MYYRFIITFTIVGLLSGCQSLKINENNERIANTEEISRVAVTYKELESTVIITGCDREFEGELIIPSEINGKPVTEIERKAFWYEKGISKISIPETVITIGDFNFAGCADLEEVAVAEDNPVFKSVNGILFAKDLKTLIQALGMMTGEYEVPDHVTSLGISAFYGSGFTTVKIPKSVNQIGTYTFGGSSPHMQSVQVHEENAVRSSIDGVLFSKDKTTLIYCPRKRMGEYSVPAGTVEIRHGAFYDCRELVKVNLPSSMEKIGYGAFRDCRSLREINLPEGLIELERGAFVRSAITNITIPSQIQRILRTSFDECEDLESITTSENHPCLMINDDVIYSKDMTQLHAFVPSKKSQFTVPENVRVIKPHAFSGARHLEKVTLPSTLTKLETHVFYECEGLESAVIPLGINEIDSYAYAGCKNLKAVLFLGDAPRLDRTVFKNCSQDLVIYYKESADGFVSPKWRGFSCKSCSEDEITSLVEQLNN